MLLVGSVNGGDGGILSLLRSNVRTADSIPDKPSAPSSTSPRSGRDYEDEDDLDLDQTWQEYFAIGAIVVATSPYLGPRMIVGDEDLGPAAFPSMPYSWHFADVSDQTLGRGQSPDRRWAWLTRLRLDYLEDFDDLSSIGGRLLIETDHRLGMDFGFQYLEEDFRAAASDRLWVGDANVLYRFAQGERLQMRSGIGINWLSDELGTDFGFNFTYGGEWFPVKPWIVSTELDIGRLGSASLFHIRATLGWQLQNVEWFTGYDHLGVGSARIDGIVVGLRLWF